MQIRYTARPRGGNAILCACVPLARRPVSRARPLPSRLQPRPLRRSWRLRRACGRVTAPGRHGPPMPRHAPGTLGAPSGAVGSDRGRGSARPPIPLASTGSRRVVTRAAAIRSLLGRKVSRTCATLHPRVHSRAPLRAPTCAEDEVDGEDPGPSQGLDVPTWRRRIVTTGASSQDVPGRC